ARLTISLSVSPLEAAYVRSRCTRVRESFTVKATLASVTATGAFNRRACRRYRYAWRGDRSQSCTIRSTASGRSSRRDSTWRAWLRRSAFSAAVARPMGHKYTTVSDRVQAPLPVPDDSLKLEVAFCVQAVASPLLANISLHRFIKAFRRYGLDHRYGAVLVTYADDFVVLRRHGAAEVLATTRRWMASIGLALHEDKTRVCKARCEPLDVLGYTFGPLYSPRTGGCYPGARPSRKAVASIKDAIRQRLWRGNPASWEELVRDLNRTVRGWATYFSYG